MTGLGLVTRGMVATPLSVLQKCRAVQENRVKDVCVKPVVKPSAVACVTLTACKPAPNPSPAPIESVQSASKPTVKVKG